MKSPIFAANWKMHHSQSDATAYMATFLADSPPRSDRTVMIFPPALSMAAVVASLHDRSDVLVGVQNIYWENKGAFTGEVSADMARDAGARVALVGHSERRHVFGETDEQTALKCAAAARAGLTPMLCVGEQLSEREAGETASVVLRQLHVGLSRLEPGQFASLAVAYEPVWAIGTGKTATPDDAATVHEVLRRALRELAGDNGAKVPILYGGSVNSSNVSQLLAVGDVDGVLVGGACLDAAGWAAIVGS